MNQDELNDELERLEFSCDGQERLDLFRSRADSLAPGTFGRAEYLTYLGQFLEMEGRLEEADAVYDEVIEDGGPTSPHPLAGKLTVSMARRDQAATAALLDELWALARVRSLTDEDHEWIGELLETHDRLREAHRWFTVRLTDFDPEDEFDLLPIGCSNGRYRVRRTLGLAHDRYDAACERHRELSKARWAEQDRLR